MDQLVNEIQKVNAHTQAMIAAYVAWGDQIVVGDVQNIVYNDLVDFLNFRIESAAACLELADRGRIADSLGLSRSVLENYLLFMLMCRGRKYIRLQDRTDLSEGEFKKYVLEQQDILKAELAAGEAQRLAVAKYPRAKRTLMHVFEGLRADNDPAHVIPIHYFQFRDFQPDTMRLKQGNYFEYLDFDQDVLDVIKRSQREAGEVYRVYLSYDALLTHLELNGLVDQGSLIRIEAHYTFLGQFLHPTHNAARELHENSNHHSGKPVVGMGAPYSLAAQLMAALYTCYLVAGLLDEIASLHESAPSEFIADAGTGDIRRLTAEVSTKFPYFWFLFNGPTLYDKFIHCVSRNTNDGSNSYSHFSQVPDDHIMFNKDIYEHFRGSLSSWSNASLGPYISPFNR